MINELNELCRAITAKHGVDANITQIHVSPFLFDTLLCECAKTERNPISWDGTRQLYYYTPHGKIEIIADRAAMRRKAESKLEDALDILVNNDLATREQLDKLISIIESKKK